MGLEQGATVLSSDEMPPAALARALEYLAKHSTPEQLASLRVKFPTASDKAETQAHMDNLQDEPPRPLPTQVMDVLSRIQQDTRRLRWSLMRFVGALLDPDHASRRLELEQVTRLYITMTADQETQVLA